MHITLVFCTALDNKTVTAFISLIAEIAVRCEPMY